MNTTFFRSAACAFLLVVGCSNDSTNQSEPMQVGTETNWLMACDSDAQCGELSCECGICTSACDATNTCGMVDSRCAVAGEVDYDDLCGARTSGGAGLCLAAAASEEASPEPPPEVTDDQQESDSAEPSETDDVSGPVGTTGTDVGSETPVETTDEAAEPSEVNTEDEDPVSMDPEVPEDGGSTPSPSDAGTADAGESSPLTGSEDGGDPAPLTCENAPRDALLGGCCFEDADCAGEELCYGAQCSEEPQPGRCATSPDGYCFDDRDCPADQSCEGGQLAACGSLAPDILGSCVGAAPQELLQGYILWDRPGGFGGNGPILELVEDGSLHLWRNTTTRYEPRQTADWDQELQLSAEQVHEIVSMLQAVDYTDLPHEVGFGECYPSLYFEGPDIDTVDIQYGAAEGLLPEMQEVYDWFDALLTAEAPEQIGPADYCPTLPPASRVAPD